MSLTEWEAFANHTHIFDEFRNKATTRTVVDKVELLDVVEEHYDALHPDFIAACEFGRTAAKLWALKLKQDFPSERFRVYYTEYDNPIVRFHKVRSDEPHWISDDVLRTSANPDFLNAIVYDTKDLAEPVRANQLAIN